MGKFSLQEQFFQYTEYACNNDMRTPPIIRCSHSVGCGWFDIPCFVKPTIDDAEVWSLPRPPEDHMNNSFCNDRGIDGALLCDDSLRCHGSNDSFLTQVQCLFQARLSLCSRFADRVPTVSTTLCKFRDIWKSTLNLVVSLVSESLQLQCGSWLFRRLLPYGSFEAWPMHVCKINRDQIAFIRHIHPSGWFHNGTSSTIECEGQNIARSSTEIGGGVGSQKWTHQSHDYNLNQFPKLLYASLCFIDHVHQFSYEHSRSEFGRYVVSTFSGWNIQFAVEHGVVRLYQDFHGMASFCCMVEFCTILQISETEHFDIFSPKPWFKAGFTKITQISCNIANGHHVQSCVQFCMLPIDYLQDMLCQYASLYHHNYYNLITIVCLNLPWIFSNLFITWLFRLSTEERYCGTRTIFRCRRIRNSRKRHHKKCKQPRFAIQIVTFLRFTGGTWIGNTCVYTQPQAVNIGHERLFYKKHFAIRIIDLQNHVVKSSKECGSFETESFLQPPFSNVLWGSFKKALSRCTWPMWNPYVSQHVRHQKLYHVFDLFRTKSIYHKKLNRQVSYVGQRVGEAKNPGPTTLDIGTFNPTQLLHKEDDIMAWGQGIYCASETSVTTAALKLLRPKFAKNKFHCVWSDPVEPIRPEHSQLRGKAAGVAIISSFPIRQYHEPVSCPIQDTNRYVDGVIQLSANCAIYTASIYGVASSHIALDPIAITNQLFNCAAERALTFKGPAVIAGDFNCYLSDIGVWETMKQHGWFDAAELDSQMHHRDPQPTSKDRVRKSFLLFNHQMAAAFTSCRTCEDHLFPTHPLLLAKCTMESVLSPSLQWILPKSVDSLMFDPELMESVANRFVQENNHKFTEELIDDPDKAASLFATAVETAWKHSCVDTEGIAQVVKQGFFGRDSLNPLQMQPPSIPIVRKARDGDFEPKLTQPSVEIRRHTRQLRRLESLLSQVKALSNNRNGAYEKCQQLWDAILKATGFRKSFAFWMCQNFHFFVPLTLPPPEYIRELLDVFREWHQKELNVYFLHKMKIRKKSILLDIAKGGSMCFDEVRDPAPIPQTFVVHQVCSRVQKVPWKKQGNRFLKVQNASCFDPNVPVTFQDQQVTISRINANMITLDHPVKLRNNNMVLVQKQITADPTRMHEVTFDAWNQHWKRDHNDPNDDQWDDVLPYLQDINPVPDMPFIDFTIELWDQHLKGLKTKTARGGCGFSANEMLNFPPSVLPWLFQIFQNCEKGAKWPQNWVLARVSMLAKTQHPQSPYDTRPITVFSILYRQWARIRSKHILQHMTSYMPKQVAMATSRIPADVAAAYVALQVEESINEGTLLAGLGIDLKRCFNTLPRWPLILAMRRLGIPEQYIAGWESMLKSMRRTLLLGGTQSTPQNSTTGAPEGCGFSVVAMAVMSWWQSQVITKQVQEVRTFTYADNWNYVANSIRVIVESLETLVAFVSCMRMTISPEKSWLWATAQQGRKRLKNIYVEGTQIPVVTSYSDLGCDVQYSKECRKPKQTKRWTKATRVCKRIGLNKAPRTFKEQMANSSAFAGATFGAPLTYVPKTKWKQLRSAIAMTTRMTSAGASPWLALGSFLNDPQLRHVCHVVRFWKRVLTTFPEVESILNKFVMQPGLSRVGPIASFQRTMDDAGWSFITPAILKHKITGFELPWKNTSRKYTQFVFEAQWDTTVAQAVQHRKDWVHTGFDPHMFVKTVNKRSPREIWVLRTAASGKHYTQDIISKYAAGVTSQCPFCNCQDNKRHRIFQCKAFQEIRGRYTKTLNFVEGNHNFEIFGLPPKTPNIARDIAEICQTQCVIQQPDIQPEDRHLFLDGSAFGQEFRDTTISAWAVVEASFLIDNFVLVGKGFVPGPEQNSYRGEVMAIRVAMESAYKGVLYVDCQSAIDVYEQLHSAYKKGHNMPQVDHSDLWQPIWALITARPYESFRLHKVKSHQDSKKLQDKFDKWIVLGNNRADVEAKSVITKHQIYTKVLFCVKKRREMYDHLINYQNLLCEIADKSFSILKEQGKQARGAVECDQSCPSFVSLVPSVTKPPTSMIPFELLPRKCPYGKVFYERFTTWFQMLEWPVNPAPGTMGFVSLIELYFNFVIVTGTEAPISTAGRGKTAKYYLLDQNILLQTQSWSLSQHTRVWCIFWNWCLKHQAFEDPPTMIEKKFIHHVGYTMQSPCLAGRPKFPHSESTYQAMWSYFYQPGGRRRTTNAPLRPLPKP